MVDRQHEIRGGVVKQATNGDFSIALNFHGRR